jgi:hypothetical protein
MTAARCQRHALRACRGQLAQLSAGAVRASFLDEGAKNLLLAEIAEVAESA